MKHKQKQKIEGQLTDTRMDIALMAVKIALLAVFKASSKVNASFSRSVSVSTTAE